MTTGQELVDAAATFLGQPYSTAPGRTSPTSGHKDCSGLIAAAYQVATGTHLGADVSVTIWKQSADQGLAISREEALTIAGACLLIPANPLDGWGPNGHIGFSTGDGHTIEATPPRVQRLPVTRQPWGPNACLLPGIDYTNRGTAPQPQEDPLMWIALAVFLDGIHVFMCSGSTIRYEMDRSNPQAPYGIPKAALDTGLRIERLDDKPAFDGNGTAWDALVRETENAQIRPTVTTVPGDCPPSLDTASLAQLYQALGRYV